MSVFHQPSMEAYFNLQAEAHEIPLYRRWNFVHSEEIGEDGKVLVHFERNKTAVAAQDVYNHHVQVTCQWLIGCDGANSSVRQHAGLKQQDLLFQYDWLVVDTLPNKDVPMSKTWTQVCNPKRPTTLIGEGMNGRRRLEFMRLEDESIEELSSPAVTWKLLEPYHMNPSNTEIERAAVYRFQALNTLEYWDGKRTVIAGDA
jgi:2-polyprenyl-6-methoxyphenol hydroxylase-like FAD-dependent oxidoreductase